jgi:peptidoglycan/LPS O-acetylase OafA/YrhL
MNANYNPYSPPKAPVAERDVAEAVPRPRIINIALVLLAVGVAFAFAREMRFPPIPLPITFVVITVLVALIKSGVIVWIGFAIARRRNWSRWVLLAIAAIGVGNLVLSLTTVPEGVNYAYDLRSAALYVLPTGINVVVACLLFGPGRAWFSASRT